MKPDRESAWALLCEYNESQALRKHALAVEGVMRHFAGVLEEDQDKWGVIGLLHDLDYEKYPEAHCKKAAEIMQERGIDEEYIHAVVSHGYGICSDVKPEHKMEKVLYAIDELTGLINAAVIMRPDKNIQEFNVKSLKKKYKSKGFAAGVDRSIIEKGCEMLEMDLQYVMEESIKGMQSVAEALGLDGNGQ